MNMPPFEDDQQPETSFDDAFAQFAEPGKTPADDTPVAEPVDEETPDDVPAEDIPEDAPAEDAPAEDTDVEAEDEGEVEEVDTPEDDDPDKFLQRLKGLLKEAPEPAPTATPEAAPPPAMYSTEEQQMLEDYEKEWPEVAKAERLRRRQEYTELTQFVFGEISKYFQPVAETVETLAMRAQLSDIQERAPDYADIRDGVVSWIDTQPAYLQVAYKHVMQQGTPEEVTDLLDRYRATTQPAKPAAPAPKKAAEPSMTAKQAARSMAPVSTKRSVVPNSGDDPNDFDSAFKKFARHSDQR